ncbi:hypothetical protein Tco_1525733 [Tanacetum coccineum]
MLCRVHAREDYVGLRQEAIELQEYSNAKLDRVTRYLGVLADKTCPSTSKRRHVHSHEHGHTSFKDRLSAQDRKDGLRGIFTLISNVVIDSSIKLKLSWLQILQDCEEVVCQHNEPNNGHKIQSFQGKKQGMRIQSLAALEKTIRNVLDILGLMLARRVCQWKNIVARAYTSPQAAPLCHLSQLSQPAVGALNNPKGTCNQAKSHIRVAIQHEKKRKSCVLRWRTLKKRLASLQQQQIQIQGSDDMSGYIVGISKPFNKEFGTEITEGLVLDAKLLDRVFKAHVTTVKSIPHGCRLAFFQALKTVLCKVYRPKNRQERRSGNRKSLQQSSILKSLVMWGKYDGITTLVKSILDGYALGSFVQGGGDFLEEGAMGNTNIKYFGRDGLRAQHILDALCGEGSATAMDLLKVITSVVNLWLAGRHYMDAFGSKVAMKGVGKEMSKYLSDFQFEVGVSGGAEAIVHSVNQVLSEYHNDGSLAMPTMDFSNAFNLVGRSALLYEVRVKCPSISLWVDFLYGQIGTSSFSLILHPLLHKFKDSCKLLLHDWYLDDGTVIGDSKEVARVLDIIKVSGPVLGLELNIKKTKIFWPSCNGMKLLEGLFPVDIWRPSSGVKFLGGAVSRYEDFISGLAIRRAANAVDLMASRAQSWVLQDHILRDSGICDMDDDYVSALACLHDTIPSFDFSGFTNKDTVPSKAQQTLTNVPFSEIVKGYGSSL